MHGKRRIMARRQAADFAEYFSSAGGFPFAPMANPALPLWRRAFSYDIP